MQPVYAIAAHTNPEHLDYLLEVLNDRKVYLHIDRSIERKKYLAKLRNLKNPRLEIIAVEESIKVSWCGYSQLQLQFKFLEKFLEDKESSGPLVFLSGECYPIRKLSDFEEYLQTKENFLSIFKIPNYVSNQTNAIGKARLHKIFRIYNQDLRFLKSIKNRSSIIYKLGSFPSKLIRVIRLPNPKMNKAKDFFEGSDWIAIGNHLAEQLVAEKRKLLEEFRFCFCPSEIAIQSFYGRSMTDAEENGFDSCNLISSTNAAAVNADFHFIHPSLSYSWKVSDLNQIRSSNKFFIRKPELTVIQLLRKEILNS